MSEQDESELHRAAREGSLEDLKKLVSARNADLESEYYGKTPLYSACAAGHTDVVQFLLDAGAQITGAKIYYNELVRNDMSDSDAWENKWSWDPVLLAACSAGHIAVVKVLLEKGASLNVINHNDVSPLHAACYKKEANDDLVRLLLSFGADVNARNDGGSTPLFDAVINGHSENAKLLIEAGANVNEMNYFGDTPLHTAVDSSRMDASRVLLEHGADVNALNKQCQTPLEVQYCLPPPSLIMLLLDYDAGKVKCCKTGCRCGLSVVLCCYNYGLYIQSSVNFAGFDERNFDIHLQAFEIYWSKMKVAGLIPLEDGEQGFAETDDFYKRYKAELEKMKTETVGDTNVTYKNIWNQRPAALRQVESLEFDDICKTFPFYGGLIRRRYVTGRTRLPFLDQAKDFFSFLPLPSLLPESVDEILSFLSKEDLQNLVSIVRTATEILSYKNNL